MLFSAAALLWLIGIAHSYLGERYILIRLFARKDLPRLFGGTAFTEGTLRFAWHLTTVAWWGLAGLLFLAAKGTLSTDRALTVIGVTAIVSAVFPLYFTRGRHVSWLVFLAIGLLVLAARIA